MARPFSDLEEAILDQLATYQFLTAPQLHTLEVNRDRKRIYAALAMLRDRRPELIKQSKRCGGPTCPRPT